MADNCKLSENRKNCPCTCTDCARYGACCECVAYHRKCGDLPSCLRK